MRLCLLRHAKSDWNTSANRDFDRPLNARGRKASAAIGAELAKRSLSFDTILASPAIRCAETLELVEQGYGRSMEANWDRRIYLASSVTLADLVRERGQGETLLMVGHNPGLEDLVLELVADDGGSPLRDVVEQKLPTAAFAVIDTDIDAWSALGEAPCRLTDLILPRELDPDLGPRPGE